MKRSLTNENQEACANCREQSAVDDAEMCLGPYEDSVEKDDDYLKYDI